jgi:hypothetical protein
MQYEILTAEITLPQYTALSDSDAADALNAQTLDVLTSYRVTIRTLFAEIGPAPTGTMVAKLEAAAAAGNKVVALALDMLKTYETDGGLDIGHAATRAAIDGLVTAGVLTADEGASVKALAVRKTSRREQLGLPPVGPHHVAHARSLAK